MSKNIYSMNESLVSFQVITDTQSKTIPLLISFFLSILTFEPYHLRWNNFVQLDSLYRVQGTFFNRSASSNTKVKNNNIIDVKCVCVCVGDVIWLAHSAAGMFQFSSTIVNFTTTQLFQWTDCFVSGKKKVGKLKTLVETPNTNQTSV